MEWWQIVLGMLGSSVLTVIAKGILDHSAARRERKNELEDRAMAKAEQKQSLEEQFNQFCAEQKKENAEIRQRLAGMESSMDAVSRNTRQLVYFDIRREALGYIRQGEVDPESRIKLKDRWAEYVANYRDDSLKYIMAEVDNLRQRELGG